MKRGGNLSRSTPLRSDPAKKLKRSRLSMTRRGQSRDWMKVRAQVLDRDGGRCQAMFSRDCTGRAEHAHHIVLRSRGGSDDPHNLVGVCHACHAHIHANPADATERGLMASNR